MRRQPIFLGAFTAGAVLLLSGLLPAETVAVRYTEGLVHGFLVLRAMDGTMLANGDLTQVARSGRVTSQLTFRFKDGSVHDETVVFTERDRFRLVTDHVVQKGPVFPRPLDMAIDAPTGQVTVRYRDDDGKDKVDAERLELPPDLANGMMTVLLKNVTPTSLPQSLSYVAATPKPRIVKLIVTAAGLEGFSVEGAGGRAEHYVIKVEIGGLQGVLAPILGKEPPLNHVWIVQGTAPAFVKSEGPLYLGGPSWRIELTSPRWPTPRPATKQ